MRLYFIALQFLTIIPLPFSVRCEEKDLGKAMAFFPLAGLTLGALLAGANFLLALCLPRPIVDLLLVAILAIVSRGTTSGRSCRCLRRPCRPRRQGIGSWRS
jgi:adenosylcobinamide-GDP ribazoletransferase